MGRSLEEVGGERGPSNRVGAGSAGEWARWPARGVGAGHRDRNPVSAVRGQWRRTGHAVVSRPLARCFDWFYARSPSGVNMFGQIQRCGQEPVRPLAFSVGARMVGLNQA
ncbi:hypothetical protein ATKI12_6541 [Kitasatospora sp. Ki12]